MTVSMAGSPCPPLPPTIAPEDRQASDYDADAESVVRMRAAPPSCVALLVSDEELRAQISELVAKSGLLTVGNELLATASAVVLHTRAETGAMVAEVRAKARTDAAVLVVLDAAVPASEGRAAYEAGAALCVRRPFESEHFGAAIRSVVELSSARGRLDDLRRQLDVETHLASLGRVMANFTHELSNPLSVLAANFETIKEQLEAAGSEDATSAMADIACALGRVRALLATARDLTRGQLAVRTERVDLASVVNDVRRWASGDLEGVAVEEILEGPIVALADPQLLRQVALNLVTNAAHAARQLRSPRVRLHVYGSRDVATLSVRDNGPGMPADVRDRIFEPFFTTRRGQGGTGLGLALCQEYARRMRARITVWTGVGRGSCFRIHLPGAAE